MSSDVQRDLKLGESCQEDGAEGYKNKTKDNYILRLIWHQVRPVQRLL